jgi:MFS/sugar transport protein
MSSHLPPVPAADLAPEPVSPPGTPKTWKVGTLTYTAGGLTALFLLLLFGDFAWAMRDRSIVGIASWYLSSLKVPNLWFGILMSTFPGAVALLLGPIISYKSDRHRGKWGRRIPFLMATTPIAAFGMLGIAATPHIAGWLHGLGRADNALGIRLHHWLGDSAMGMNLLSALENEEVVAVLCFSVFWAAFEFATIASQSVFGGLINDVVPQALLGRFYALFRAVSLIDGIIFNYWIMGKVPDHFSLILATIGVFYGLAFMWVCLKVKEGQYPPPPPLDDARKSWSRGFLDGARTFKRECFSHPYYLRVFVLIMTATMCFVPINTFSIPYAKSYAVDMNSYGNRLAFIFAISLCLAWPLGWLCDLFHPLRVIAVSLVAYLGVMLFGVFGVHDASTYLTAYVLHGIISGCYFTSVASLGQRLYPREKFAQFASAALLFAAPLQMSLAPLVGLVIDHTGNVYRHAFTVGGVLVSLAIISFWSVYVRFKQLGGPKHYIAP